MEDHAPAIRISLLPLAGGLTLACALGAAAGLLLASFMKWEGGPWSAPLTAAAGAACFLLGSILGVIFANAFTGGLVHKLPTAILISSGVRAAIALFDALAIALVFRPDSKTFWFSFLISGLACLAFETRWSLSAIRRATAQHAPATLGAA